MVEKQGQVLGHTYEIANYQCYITLLKCMRDTKTDNSIIIKTILEALIFNKRACTDPYELHLTVLVNAFNNELHLSSRIPYYLMSLLKTTSLNDYETLKSELLTTENNIQYRRYFLNIIAEGDNFYEGMIKDVTKFV